MTVGAVLFDYGHTLVDFHRTEEALHEAYRRVRELVVEAVREDHPVPATERLVADLARTVEDLVAASYEQQRLEELDLVALFDDALDGIGYRLPERVVRRVVELDHTAYTTSLSVPDETVTVLEALRGRGVKVGFVSNAHFLPHLLRRDLDTLGLGPLLDGGAFSSEVGTRKPDPRIFRLALEQLGVAPERTIMVGDRVRDDIVGARNAGLAGGVLTHQYRREEPAGDELAVVATLTEVLELV